jgi:hypothetical protein
MYGVRIMVTGMGAHRRRSFQCDVNLMLFKRIAQSLSLFLSLCTFEYGQLVLMFL